MEIEGAHTELAKRAVRCKGWKWIPGMVSLAGRGHGILIRLPGGWWEDSIGKMRARKPRGVLPYLAHPATKGCLLELVRMAWDKDDMSAWRNVCVVTGEDHGWVCQVPDGAEMTGSHILGDTEAHALVAALEAAP